MGIENFPAEIFRKDISFQVTVTELEPTPLNVRKRTLNHLASLIKCLFTN